MQTRDGERRHRRDRREGRARSTGAPRDLAATGALLVLGIGSLVAAGLARARPGRSQSAPTTLDVSGLLIVLDRVVLTAGIVLAVGIAGVLVWAVWKGEAPHADTRMLDMLRQVVRFVFLIYIVTVLAAFVLPRLMAASGTGLGEEPLPVEQLESGDGDATSWWPLAGVVAASVASLTALWFLRERATDTTRGEVGDDAAEVLSHAVTRLDEGDVVDDVVIASYQRMEQIFTGRGLGRWVAEAPAEYLARVMASVDVDPAAPERLAALYERARFGAVPVGASGRADAREALARLLREVNNA